MKLRKFSRYAVGVIAGIGLYLVVVGVWASQSVGALLPGVMARSESLQLSEEQTEVLLRIEDPRFFDHAGLDISQGQGLTTVTGSLAREIFLAGEELEGVKGRLQSFYQAVFACCKEIDFGRDVMALVLNRHLSKEQQLQLFASPCTWGETIESPLLASPLRQRPTSARILPICREKSLSLWSQ